MLDKLITYDTSLFVFLNGLGSTSWDGFWLIITNKLTFIPLYALLLYLLYRAYGWKALLIMVVTIALMITFTDQFTNFIKRTVQRPRPCGNPDIIDQMRFIAVRCGKYGYFSGHSSNSMAVAVFTGLMLRKYYKNLIFFLLFWSAVVGYSRIYVGVHYPLDVLSGFTFGAFSGYMFYRLTLYLIRRFTQTQ